MVHDMARLQCGGTRCQIAGTVVPVAEFDLAPDDWIYCPPHALLWTDAATTLDVSVPVADNQYSSSWAKRSAMGLPNVLLQCHGPGHVGVSENHAGDLIAVPVRRRHRLNVRRGRFLCATGSVSYRYHRSPIHYRAYYNGGRELDYEYPAGRFHDSFTAAVGWGLLLLHSSGNAFVRDLAAGESILVKPPSLLYWEASVDLSMHLEYMNTPGKRNRRDPSSYRTIWLRLLGPGRVAVQSAFEPEEGRSLPDWTSFASTQRW